MFAAFAFRFPPFRLHLWRILGLCLAAASGASAQDAPVLGAPAVQRLSFAEGPNWVSLRVYPQDRSLEAIFGSRLSRVLTVKDAAGASYAPQHGARDLGEWPWDEAVFVYARQPFVLDVAGREIVEDSHIFLATGWHQIPYLLADARPPAEALASILPALLEVQDGDGRTYPATGGAPALETLEPGTGYRVRLSSPAELVYAVQSPPAANRTVATVAEAVALQDLTPGQRIAVTDPVRGGTFVVRDSGAPSDGGTVFVPSQYTKATTASGLDGSQTLFDGPNDEGIVFDSFRLLYGPDDEDDILDATALHGHASGKGDVAGEPLLNTQNGRLLIPNGLRKLAKSLTGSNKLRASYRYATSTRRLERVVEPIVLEGLRTTDYVRPEWWGAVPYPADWTPDTSAPSGPRARPRGIATGDPVYDATDRLASAINAAEAAAAETSRQHYVVLAGMYGFSRILETQDGAVIKGERDGVRDGQGLRVLKGAPWRYWAVKEKHVDPAYYSPRTPVEYLLKNADPVVTVRHGRSTHLGRVVDIEIDGNVPENEYVVSNEYQVASGKADAPYGNFRSRVEELLQNTAQWNGFVASHLHLDGIPGSNARLENVHIHDVGGNTILGNNPIHFGGSYDVLLGNNIKNHHMYGVYTAEGTVIDGIEIYGFSWNGLIQINQGHYKNIVFNDLEINPHFGYFEDLIGHRTKLVDIDHEVGNPQSAHYYFGDQTILEDIRIELPENLRPSPAAIYYSRGPFAIRGLTVNVEGDKPLILFNDRGEAQDERSQFELSDLVVENGQVRGLSAWPALRADIRNVALSPDMPPNRGGGGFLFRPIQPHHVATIYDVGQGAPLQCRELITIKPRGSSKSSSLDVFVQRSQFDPSVEALKMLNADPSDPDTQGRFRVFWRDVTFVTWKDSNETPQGHKKNVGLQYFERVTARGRASESTGSLSSATLTRASNGTRYVDVDPEMFYAPQKSSYVVVTGRDAGRFTGWENVGDTYDPVLRLSFSGTSPVSVDWAAAIRPIPSDVVFPE